MRLLFLFFSIFLVTSGLLSQTYEMNVNLSDGTIITYDITEILKIDFNIPDDVTSLTESQNILTTFKLIQNYPNPFNPSTTIQYELPNNGKVKVSIFDLKGRLVKTLLEQSQQIGVHKIIWDGKNKSGVKASSGFYIYSVRFENSIFSKKMILLK